MVNINKEMNEFLRTSALTESKVFVHSFAKNISVKGKEAMIHYTVPMPGDSPVGKGNIGEIELETAFRNTGRSQVPLT